MVSARESRPLFGYQCEQRLAPRLIQPLDGTLRHLRVGPPARQAPLPLFGIEQVFGGRAILQGARVEVTQQQVHPPRVQQRMVPRKEQMVGSTYMGRSR